MNKDAFIEFYKNKYLQLFRSERINIEKITGNEIDNIQLEENTIKIIRDRKQRLARILNTFLFIPTEYIHLYNVYKLINKLKFKNYFIHIDYKKYNIIPVSIDHDKVFYGPNNDIFIPLINKGLNYDLTYIYYDLFDFFPLLISNNVEKKNYLSLRSFGPNEITNKKLDIYTDIFKVIEKFRKNKLKDIDNNYEFLLKPMYFNQKLKYNKFVLDSNDLDIKTEIGDYFNKDVFKTLMDNEKKYYLIESRKKHHLNKDNKGYNKLTKIYLLYEYYIILEKMENNGCFLLDMDILYEFSDVLFLYKKCFSKLYTFYSGISNKYFLVFLGFNGETYVNKSIYKNLILRMQHYRNKFDKDEDINFTDFLFNINLKKNVNKEELKIFSNKLIYLNNKLNNDKNIIHNVTKNGVELYEKMNTRNKNKFLKEIRDINFNLCFSFIKKYNWEINNFYKSENINKDELKKIDKTFIYRFFPKELEVDGKIIKPQLNKIKYSLESLFSITPYNDAERTIFLMASFMKKRVNDLKNLVITDGTTNVGGNMIVFCKYFKYVNGVEIEGSYINQLDHNLKLYKFNNYKLHNEDYSKYYNKLNQDIIFFDPPWGGILYKYYEKISLYLNNTEISFLIKDMNCKYVFVKVPKNYDMENLQKNVDFSRIFIYKMRNVLILLIEKNMN